MREKVQELADLPRKKAAQMADAGKEKAAEIGKKIRRQKEEAAVEAVKQNVVGKLPDDRLRVKHRQRC